MGAILVPFLSQTLRWYYTYKNNLWLFYLKGLVTQEELYANPCKICHQFKMRNTHYGHLPLNNIAELKPWDMAHVDLIGPYINDVIQQQPGTTTVNICASLICMAMIDPDMGWFEVVEVPSFDLTYATNYIIRKRDHI